MKGRTTLRALAMSAVVLISLLAVQEALARGRGGGGGFRRGGGGGHAGAGAYGGGGFPRGGYSGGVSRSGPARNGSIRGDRYPSQTNPYSRGGSYGERQTPGSGERSPTGVIEGPRGGTIDREVTRDGDVVHREVTVTGPDGETATYEGVSKRTDDGVVSRGHLETSGGIDAQTGSRIEKTDGGFVAHGGAIGEDGAARGTIRKDGDTVNRRGIATDGDDVVIGRSRCKDGECRGARVYADTKTYKYDDYYYYPYYHYWYACPMGATPYRSRYGAPVYGCANTIVISTTVYLDQPQSQSPVKSLTGDSGSSSGQPAPAATTSAAPPTPAAKSRVRSGAAMVYEAAEGVSVYATSWKPDDVYSEPHEGQFYWVGGESEATPELQGWIASAVEAREKPDANATVISYEVSDRTVYLTSEPAAPGTYAKQEEGLYAWIPGVSDPSDEDEAAIATALRTQAGAGGEALEKEVRGLEEGREDPPAV